MNFLVPLTSGMSLSAVFVTFPSSTSLLVTVTSAESAWPFTVVALSTFVESSEPAEPAEEDERVINEARDYNIIGAAYQKSPDALEDAKKRLTEDSYKKFEEIVLQPTKKQEMLLIRKRQRLQQRNTSVRAMKYLISHYSGYHTTILI